MQKEFDKNLIAKNFSRGAKIYNDIAEPQLAAAKKLVRLASPFIANNSQILDLGCGTSFIAKEICQNFSAKIIETDISSDMLKSWIDRPKNVLAIQCDIENLPFGKKSFDIIFSSFALHWIKDFEKNFAQFSTLLKNNGILAFCIPTAGSLDELSSSNIFQFNKFPNNAIIKSALKKNGVKEIQFSCESKKQKFESGYEALKFIKKIGGNSTQSKKVISKTKLKEFNSFCLKNFSDDNKSFSISWNISYFIYQI